MENYIQQTGAIKKNFECIALFSLSVINNVEPVMVELGAGRIIWKHLLLRLNQIYY